MSPSDSIALPPADRLLVDSALWPWIYRFFWEPARDLHPARHPDIAAALPPDIWDDPRLLGHLSEHVRQEAGIRDEISWTSDDGAFRIALLPAAPLERLARLLGLTLTGADDDELDDEDERFLVERAPLYWARGRRDDIAAAEAGWLALRAVIAQQPEPVRRLFDFKTPPLAAIAPVDAWAAESLLALTRRILRELEEPWCSLFATPAH